MKHHISILLLFFPLVLLAQERKNIPETDNLTKGVLPNGISYFLVSNNNIKGYADFSLIQSGMAGNRESRKVLSKVDNFKISPYKFLASKGIGYGPDGYISTVDDNDIINFRNVPVYDSAAADSTLLLMFDLVRTSPAQQALIICGDIDAPELLQQIKMLSLSVPERTAITELPPYRWEPSLSPTIVCNPAKGTELAEISISYASRRTPREFLSGSRPFVSEMLARQLGSILTGRVRDAFKKEGIPVSGVSATSTGSGYTSGDEQFSLSVKAPAARTEEAIALLARTLATLDRDGAEPGELRYAKGAYLLALRQAASGENHISNKEYTDRCTASYLYGAPVVSQKAVRDYFTGLAIDPQLELSVFNKFASALLSADSNLTLTVKSAEEHLDKERIASVLAGNWKASDEVQSRDLPGIPAPAHLKKQKVKSTLTDPVTGGTIWTFANGFKLIYKNIPGSDGFSYSLALRGGLTFIPGLAPGESAFASDMLRLFRVAGLDGDDFRKSLIADGITFEPGIGISDFRISGEAPEQGLETLMRALAAYALRRQTDDGAFKYYKLCKALEEKDMRTKAEGIRADMEDLASDGDFYSSVARMQNLSDNLPWKMERYLETMFGKTDDGALIVVGNIDKDQLLGTVSRYAGQFGTGRKAAARTNEKYTIVPGWNTRVYDDIDGINILLSAYYPFSIKNATAFETACEAISIELCKALADEGLYAVTERNIYLNPSERFSLFISCRPCNPEGLPDGVKSRSSQKALNAVRSVITSLSLTNVDEPLMEASISNIRNRYESLTGDPAFMLEASVIRNSLGLNLVSGYRQALKEVGESDVRKVLEAFDGASKVEFINK